MTSKSDDHIRNLLAEFASVTSRYEALGIKLTSIISELLDAKEVQFHAITTRPKSLKSLEDKLKRKAYSKLTDITDLCGVRCICYFQEDVSDVVDLLYDNFSVDRIHTVDKRISPMPEVFGYRSCHVILSLNEARLSLPENRQFSDLKAEVQIRSILDHAWAEIQHDSLGYKSLKAVPVGAQRLLAKAAALLEVADSIFSDAKRVALEEVRELPRIRSEGVSELIPDFQVDVESGLIQKSLSEGCNSLLLLLNLNITNRCLPGDLLDGVSVRCNARLNPSPLRPRLAGPNGLSLDDVLGDPLFLSRRHVSFTVSGLRCNANQLGCASGSSPMLVFCALAAGQAERPSERYSLVQKNVAQINTGVFYTSRRATCDPSQAENGICPLITVRFTAQFPGALTHRVAEKDSIGVAASHGTRLCLRLTGLASDAKYFVDPVTRGRLAKLVFGADANGAGGSCVTPDAPLDGPAKPTPIPAGQHNSGGAVALFFEIMDDADCDHAELTLYTELGSPPPSELRLTGNLAPTSTVFTASSTAPIPRFVDNPQSTTFRFDGLTGPNWMAWGQEGANRGPTGPTGTASSETSPRRTLHHLQSQLLRGTANSPDLLSPEPLLVRLHPDIHIRLAPTHHPVNQLRQFPRTREDRHPQPFPARDPPEVRPQRRRAVLQ